MPVRVKKTRQIKSFSDRRFRQARFCRAEHFLKCLPERDVGALDAQGRPWTEDGVHLNQDGYVRWIGAIESAVGRECP